MEIKLHLINQKIKEDPAAFIAECEEAYYQQVHAVANYVRAHYKERPIVLLSGPSGSGKTTTAHLLERLLDESGHETHSLSTDDYFRPMSKREQELAAAKKLDLESPARVDQELLQAHLQKILDGQPVDLPTYNFVTADREYHGHTLHRKEGEIVILEGIHALNPDVVGLSEDKTVRLYVSVRTRIVDDENKRLHPSYIRLMRRMLRDRLGRGREISHTLKMFDSVQRGEALYIMPHKRLHPSYIRLMRRMLRDRLGRGREISHTLKMFDSVQRGEALYIMPHKPHSLFDIDTIIPYECAIYKKELLPQLCALPQDKQVDRLIAFLEQWEELSPDVVPENSLIQEFI